MLNNIIPFKKKAETPRPNDLMTIREFCNTYGFKYSYVYKYSVRAQKEGYKGVTVYHKGQKAISESEFLKFEKERAKNGRNK